MNSNPDTLRRRAGARELCPRRQAGVVVFVALLVMVALALAGIALIRSTDTTTTVSGNLVLKQAATSAVDRGIEQTIHALWEASPALDRTQHSAAQELLRLRSRRHRRLPCGRQRRAQDSRTC